MPENDVAIGGGGVCVCVCVCVCVRACVCDMFISCILVTPAMSVMTDSPPLLSAETLVLQLLDPNINDHILARSDCLV